MKNLIIFLAFAFGGLSMAQANTQFLQVDGKNHYKGSHTVRLKRLANQQLMNLGEDPDGYKLVGVTLRAKSKHGHGTATLVVGGDQEQKNVPDFGGDAFFVVTTPWSYHDIHWNLQRPGQSDERWQLRLNGNIKTRGITLELAKRGRRIRIPMGDQLFTGQDSIIYLRQELRAMGINPQGKRLKKVVLVAKSKRGHGQVELKVGQNFTTPKTIPQAMNGFGFQAPAPASYNRIRFRVNGPTQGVWQLHMRGRIKVKAVIVELR